MDPHFQHFMTLHNPPPLPLYFAPAGTTPTLNPFRPHGHAQPMIQDNTNGRRLFGCGTMGDFGATGAVRLVLRRFGAIGAVRFFLAPPGGFRICPNSS